VEKWLFVRFRAIGDVVMCAWPMTAVRLARPEAEFWFASERGFQTGIAVGSLAQHVHLADRKQWRSDRWSPATWSAQVAHYLSLRKVGFDYGVDFQGHCKTALLLRLSGANQRIQTQATDALSARLNPLAILTTSHKVENYLETINSLGTFRMPEMPIMPKFELLTDLPEAFVSINTGTSSAEKAYPLENWQVIARSLLAKGHHVIGLGGPKDPELGVEGVVELAGRTSLQQTFAIVQHSKLHLVGDTATGHVAAAYGTPFASIFVSVRNSPERFRPYSENGKVFRPETGISPEHILENI
jgi:heptosyltransferase I